jgi:hypothetical protein
LKINKGSNREGADMAKRSNDGDEEALLNGDDAVALNDGSATGASLFSSDFGSLNSAFSSALSVPGFHGVGGGLSQGSNGHVFHTYPSVGNAPAEKIDITARTTEALTFFMSDEGGKYTKAQAQGIVANLIAESGLRTNLPGDGGLAWGIAQWHPDRQAQYAQQFGVDMKHDKDAFRHQLAFVKWELNHTEAAAGRNLREQSTPQGAAASLVYNYERPLDKSGDAYKRARIAGGLNKEADRIADLKTGFQTADTDGHKVAPAAKAPPAAGPAA